MQASSIKVFEKTKKRIDILQAEIVIKLGRKLSQQELFEKLVEFVIKRNELFFEDLKEIKYPLKAAEIERILATSKDWGVLTREDEIDELVYGG